jgi:hypothetical protein
MSIRTIEQLHDFLENEIVWRKKEVATLRSLAESARASRDKQNALIRSGITLLYAHWEGFVKAAASAYLEFVAMQRLSYQDLAANFIALAMKGKLEEATQTNKASIFNEVAQFFLTGLTEKSRIPYQDAVDTRSNLSSEVFREIVYMLGLDYLPPYATKEKLIDTKLLHLRNTIAHGNYLLINLGEYRELHQEMIILMDTFRNQIDNAAITKAYRRSPSA